jgi:hypothetical protein
VTQDDILRYGMYFMEGVAAITGFLYWKKIKNRYWKWFPVYLGIIFLTELYGEYLFTVRNNQHLNGILYTYWAIPLQFLFFCWLFYRYFENSAYRWWPLVCAFIYLLAWVADMTLLKNVSFAFTSFSYMMGNIILLLHIILFFTRFSASNDILHYWQSQMFWVSIGLLVFYLGSLPFFGLWNNIRHYKVLFNNYWKVQMYMGCMMYGFFAISFIWNKKN